MRSVRDARIGIIGLGDVGLPLAVEFGKHYPTVFDLEKERVAELEASHHSTLEVTSQELHRLVRTTRTLLAPLKGASETVGSVLKKGDASSTADPNAVVFDIKHVLPREQSDGRL